MRRESRAFRSTDQEQRGTAHSLNWERIRLLAFIICCAFFLTVGCQIRTAIRQVIGPSEQETENSPCCEVEGRKYFSKKRKYPDAIVAGHGKKRGKVTQWLL